MSDDNVVVDVNETANPEFMSEFFDLVGQIKSRLGSMKKNMVEMESLSAQEQLSADSSVQRKTLDDLLRQTNTLAFDIKQKLSNMKRDIDATEDEDAQKRIKKAQYTQLTKKFSAQMQEYQTIQSNYKKQNRERIQRQAKIVNPNLSEDEVDRMIQDGSAARMFAPPEEQEFQQTAAKLALMSIQQQQQELQQLERSMNELHQMFLEMDTMLATQQEIINTVDTDLEISRTHAGKAVQYMTTAEQANQARRQKQGVLFTFLALTILIGGGVGIGGWLLGWWGPSPLDGV